MGLADKIQSKISKKDVDDVDKQGGKVIGKDNLTGEVQKQYKEGNLNKEEASKYANDLDKKAGNAIGKENISGIEGGIGTKFGSKGDSKTGASPTGKNSDAGNVSGSGLGSGAAVGAAGAGGAAYGSSKSGGMTSDPYSKDSSRTNATSDPYGKSSTTGSKGDSYTSNAGSGAYGSSGFSGFDTSGSGVKSHSGVGTSGKGNYGSNSGSGQHSSTNDYAISEDQSRAAVVDSSAPSGAAGYVSSRNDVPHKTARDSQHSNAGNAAYGSGANYLYGKLSTSKDDTSSNSGFSTGNDKLDSRISSLDPSVQKQAKEAFHKGYKDAQDAFRT